MKIATVFKGRDWISFINIYTIFIVFMIMFSIFIPNFFSLGNLDNFFRQGAITMLLSLGMTFLLLSGNFDLSVEGQIAVIAIIIAELMNFRGMAAGWAFVLAPLIGMVIGLFNGILSSRIPSFIVTLGTLVITRGVALLIHKSQAIANFPEVVLAFTRQKIFGIQIIIFYVVIGTILAIIVSKKTVFGRQIFAIGGNREAARSCGIPINKDVIGLFVLMGFISGFCALLLMGKVNAAHPLAMEGASLETVTAVIIGGTSLYGGSGTIFGSVVGAGFITILSIVFNLIGVSSAWKRVILGLVLIAVVLFDYLRKRLLERRLG